ncbi:amidase [Ahrensia marina]|uniref:amidase n=1 Tax=Ahrensia marina TaxID=1514904 RepID=UPI0035D13873
MQDATALAAVVAAGETTSEELMRASLDRAESSTDIGAFVRFEPELGLAAARASDVALASGQTTGPFYGLPFLAKDLGGYSKGLMPTAGSAALAKRSEDPADDDALFAAFRTAGLVPFGLTTVPEFGLALTSEPLDQSPARNPFDTNLSPGGSSGGAAAAVAAGVVALAHATDAAGSIRVPAACCGLVGHKASRHRVPGAPHFNNHLMGIASELVVARSVRDARALFEAVRLDCPNSETSVQRLGICVPRLTSAATSAKMHELARALEAIGIEVVMQPSPDGLGDRAMALAGTIFAASLASWLDSFGVSEDEVTPICAAVAARGRAMAAPTLFDAHTDLVRLAHESQALFADVDALVMPVLSDGPPAVGSFDPNQTDPDARYAQMNAVAPNVALANVAGLPSLAMPFGMMPAPRDHIPFGFQIMGPANSDEALFELAARIEALAPSISFPYPIAGFN